MAGWYLMINIVSALNVTLWPRRSFTCYTPCQTRRAPCASTVTAESCKRGVSACDRFDPEGATLEDAACPHKEFTQVTQSTGLLLSVIAETALVAMPEDGDKPRAAIRPARGRRLLVFSDSRREAARLGPALTYSHEIQMIRSEFSRLLESATAEDTAETKAVLEEDLEQIAKTF